MDSFFGALWLATQPPDIQCYSLIHLQLLGRQTRVSYEHNSFPVLYCWNKQRNFTNNQTSCYRNTWRRWRNSVWKFKQVKRWREFSHETREKFFCLMQLESCVSLFTSCYSSCYVHKTRLKTTFNRFLQNGFRHKKNHDSFWRKFPALKSLTWQMQCLPQFYLSAGKRDGRSVTALKYLTVSVYTNIHH